MENGLKTRVTVELEDDLVLFDSTEKSAYQELGIALSTEFNHYRILVGTVLRFKEWVAVSPINYEVIAVDTIAYSTTQRQGDNDAYDIRLTYIVKRLEPVRFEPS